MFSLWNWKSATVSAVVRASIFFAVNLQTSRDAAWAAWTTELVLRLATSGFYGGLTQELSAVEPAWHGMVAAMVLLPLLSHTLEIAAHLARGTPDLAQSIAASVAFTVLSTTFNVFAMRRGALVTGAHSQSLLRDLAVMPRMIVAFVGYCLRSLLGAVGYAVRHSATRVRRVASARVEG